MICVLIGVTSAVLYKLTWGKFGLGRLGEAGIDIHPVSLLDTMFCWFYKIQ